MPIFSGSAEPAGFSDDRKDGIGIALPPHHSDNGHHQWMMDLMSGKLKISAMSVMAMLLFTAGPALGQAGGGDSDRTPPQTRPAPPPQQERPSLRRRPPPKETAPAPRPAPRPAPQGDEGKKSSWIVPDQVEFYFG